MPRWASQVYTRPCEQVSKLSPDWYCSVPGHETRAWYSVEPQQGRHLSPLLRGGRLPNCSEVADSLIRHFSRRLSGASSPTYLSRQGRRFQIVNRARVVLQKPMSTWCSQTLEITPSSLPTVLNSVMNSSSSQEPDTPKKGVSSWYLETPDKHLLLLPLVTGD